MVESDKVPFVCSLMIKQKRKTLKVLYHKKLMQLPMLQDPMKPTTTKKRIKF